MQTTLIYDIKTISTRKLANAHQISKITDASIQTDRQNAQTEKKNLTKMQKQIKMEAKLLHLNQISYEISYNKKT